MSEAGEVHRRKEMTRDEAIKVLENATIEPTWGGSFRATSEALDMAIEALKAQDRPIICPRCGRVFAESEGRDHE